jgi:glycine cleavage system transcriptional repressor
MQITCISDAPVETVDAALAALRDDGVDVRVGPIETYIG